MYNSSCKPTTTSPLRTTHIFLQTSLLVLPNSLYDSFHRRLNKIALLPTSPKALAHSHSSPRYFSRQSAGAAKSKPAM